MTRKVLITGVSGGIGQALVEHFDGEGWKTIGLDKKPPVIVPDRFIELDLSDHQALSTFCSEFIEKQNQLSALVNNAALQVESSLEDLPLQDWERMVSVNLTAPFLLSRSLLGILSGGAIVNISSIHARVTAPGLGGYAATKGGLCALTRAMALEFAGHNIRVNAVLPGAVDTPMLERGLSRMDDPDQAREKIRKRTPLNRIVRPDQIAQLVHYLADEKHSKDITGQEFVCDGGVSAQLASEV